MAYYGALVSVIQILDEIIHRNQYKRFHLNRIQVSSVHKKFSHLQASLEDYWPKVREATDVLETRIKDAANEAEDIIETQVSKREMYTSKVRKPLLELEKVKTEVDSIVEELMRMKMESHRVRDEEELQLKKSDISEDAALVQDVRLLEEICHHNQLTIKESQPCGESSELEAVAIVDSIVGTSKMQASRIDSTRGASKVQAKSDKSTTVIFDEHLMTTIKEQLCGQSLKREVISIVGMGGIGKTTLARNIFDDKLIDYHFDCRALIIISQDYHLENILQAIVSLLKIEAQKEKLGECIHKHLKGRRYLIIMDDMWDTKVWDEIKRVLPDDHNGSRILITTRQSDVASYSSSSINHIPLLNEHQSWKLFCEKAFCPPELEDIGKLIAKNCRGLPLAIVVVAGLLSKPNTTPCDWEEIARGISSTVAKTDKHFSKILSLSYNHLPHYLKPCFLYLGGFPEDYQIRVSKLMQLWVAEGFLKPLESKCLEEAAEKYFEELVNRNLVMITKWGPTGKFKYCVIHDLLRDLCSEMAPYEKFHFIHSYKEAEEEFYEEAIRNVRRLYIHGSSSLPIFGGKEYVSNARSVLYLRGSNWLLPYDSRLLRVLDAEYTNFALRFLIGHLHLRCIACNSIDSLYSISELKNLQTLVIKEKHKVLWLEIWKMPHLRHVMIDDVRFPPIPHDGKKNDRVPLLGMLQTLSTVVNFTFTRDTVEMIPNLKKLKIRPQHFWYHKNPWEKFGLINLIHLHQLEKLEIKFNETIEDKYCENFVFPLSLKKLTLKDCHLPWKGTRVLGSLPNLQILELKQNFKRIADIHLETKEGEFPKLKYLKISNSRLFWGGENISFPCLERLILIQCESTEIPSAIGDIPTLELIEAKDCSLALQSSALRIQEEQGDLGNDILQVRIVSCWD